MANPEHVEILKQGVEVWNEWRTNNQGVIPDLSGHFIQDENLGARIIGKINAEGSGFDHLEQITPNFNRVIFSGASLARIDFSGTSLIGADFKGVHLTEVNVTRADLRRANFSGAFLFNPNFYGALLEEANFADAKLQNGLFGENDLSKLNNLQSVSHFAPSSISIDTIYKSRGKIPDIFLRGCGLPESFIVQIPALIAAMQTIQFYSCFISYSSKDHPFAERLHADLQSKGVRCWFAPEDLKIGDRFRDRIDESIRLHDKLLIVLSKNSVASPWVSDEVESAIEREHRECRTVLFPIKIDDAVMECTQAWAASIRRTRHIGDFTRWEDHDSYSKAFDRLLRDLKAGEVKP